MLLVLSFPGLVLKGVYSYRGLRTVILIVGLAVALAGLFNFPRLAAAATSSKYVVKEGDCLWLIAQRNHISVTALKQANGLKSEFLTPGQALYIPIKGQTVSTSPSSTPGTYYKVKQGDCLWLIAQRNHVSVDQIKKANGLATESLKPGQVLCIPGGKGTNGLNRAVNPAVKTAGTVPSRSGDTARDLMNFAQSFLGTPYRWAGESPSGFDCSGFTRYVFGKFGVSLPHSAAAQFSCGTPVQRSELAPGDLLLFHTLSPGIDHAAIYCGGGRFIHASSRGGCVKTDSLNENYWDTHLVGARRVL